MGPEENERFVRETLNPGALEAELGYRVDGEVRFDRGSRALYATDASNYRQIPIGVVIPRNSDAVVETLRICRSHGAPVVSRGGGTGLCGQTCNVAVVIDHSKYLNSVLELDPDGRRARVQPGTVLDTLRSMAEQHHLTFGPDPATHDHNTLGGMLGNNSCGIHSVMSGKTVDNVLSLVVSTYDGTTMRVGPTPEDELQAIIRQGGRRGEIYRRLADLAVRYERLIRERYPRIPRRVSGYNLDQLLPENGFNVAGALVGTEGTCITILEAELRLVHSPPARTLLLLGYPDVFTAGDHVPELLAFKPVGLEGLDDLLIHFAKRKGLHPENLSLLPEGNGWLLAEFGGTDKRDADEQARAAMEALSRSPAPPTMKLFSYPAEEQKIWQIRESGLGAIGSRWPGLVNFMLHAPLLGEAAKAVAGIAPERQLPRFAAETFTAWYRRAWKPLDSPRRVLLYADPFNDCFYPGTLAAAARVLHHYGYRVEVLAECPPAARPPLDYGMIGMAVRDLRRIVELLLPTVREGVPVVVLEPSTAALFRSELPELLPQNLDGCRLSGLTCLLAEFFATEKLEPPRLGGKIIFQPHCHMKAVLDVGASRVLFKKMGLHLEEPQATCCGMAGSFGFEKKKYHLSMKIAEMELLPAIRAAGDSARVVADGFSCRTQILDGTGRRALHTAELLAEALGLS